MPTSAKVAVGALGPTVGDTCDLKVEGFGTPTAAIIFASDASTTDNPQPSYGQFIGVWTSVAQRAIGVSSANNLGTSRTGRQQKTGAVLARPVVEAGGSVGRFYEATAAAITDGIRLTVSYSGTGVTRYVYAVLINGTTNAAVVDINLGTGTSAIDVTSLGFRPDFLCALGTGAGSNTLLTHAITSIGFAHNDGTTTTQGFVGAWSEHNTGTSDTGSYISASHIGGQVFNGTASWLASVSDFDADGFSITPTANAASDVLYVLALELADANDAYVGIVDSKTSTGTQAYTGTGFTPEVVSLLSTIATATGTVTRTNAVTCGASDGTRSRSISVRDRDAVTTMDSDSQSADVALLIRTGTGTEDARATIDTLDSDGWTLDYTTGSAVARKMLAFAIGDSTAGAGAPTLSDLQATSITATTVQGTYDYAF